ncbi:MAG TPA: hypothetical protein VIE65_04545, partial [Methylobacter sp.]
EAKAGLFIAPSEIVKIQAVGEDDCTIKTRSGKVYSVNESAEDVAQNSTPYTVCGIPAEPGYFVVEAIPGDEDDDKWEAWLIPVVGWCPVPNAYDFDYLYESSPILAGTRMYRGEWALVWPDGKVTNTCARGFKSVQEWLDYAKTADESED